MPFPLVLPSQHLDTDRIIRLSHIPEVFYNSVHPCSEATQQQERPPRVVGFPRVSPEQGRQASREQSTLSRQQLMDVPFPQRLRERGMVETHIDADGNCQFRALADQLFSDQERHAELRIAAVNQLRSEPEHYGAFVHDEDWESYVQRMKRDGEWGDQRTLQAVADAYKVTAHVYSHDPEMPFPLVLPSQHLDTDRIIRLSHVPEVHYSSVHPSSEATQQQERQRRA
jgi:hypothetical protein